MAYVWSALLLYNFRCVTRINTLQQFATTLKCQMIKEKLEHTSLSSCNLVQALIQQLNAVQAICIFGCYKPQHVIIYFGIIVSGDLFVQIDSWLSVINGGYNYGDLLRDSSPHIKAGEKNLQSAEVNAAFLARFASTPLPKLHNVFTHVQLNVCN